MWKIEEFDSVTSTNTLAKERLAAGAIANNTVLQTMHQTAGRGRLGDRRWNDEPKSALLMSIVLERVPFSQISLVSYFAALSVVHAVRVLLSEFGRDSGTQVGREAAGVTLKWPNDILISGKKLCGVLCEGIWQGQTLKGVVVGIGLNVRQQAFEGALGERATSLLMNGVDVSVNDVRDRVLDSIANDLTFYEAHDADSASVLLETLRRELLWMTHLPPLDVLLTDSITRHGLRYEGISNEGALWLRHPDGTRETFITGSLRWDD